MRTTIVPAQITTVEDKIAGNLTLAQIFLLLLPVFLGGFFYISLPPYLNFAGYKIALFFIIGILSGFLAIRIKGKMVISWLIVLLRYTSRPRYFIYDKNDSYQRVIIAQISSKKSLREAIHTESAKKTIQKISIAQAMQLERFLHDPKAKVRFTFMKKGGLNVSFSEVS